MSESNATTANGWVDKSDPKVYQVNKLVVMDMDHVEPGGHEASVIWNLWW